MYGLEFQDIYGRIQDYAGINNVTGSDTKAKKAANDALRLIASLRNWKILKRESTITPVASTQAYTLIAGFDHITACWYISNGIRVPIEIVDNDRWNRESDNDTDGNPEICRITRADGTQKIQFSPLPSSSFISSYTNIPYSYVKKPTELSGDTDVPEIPDTSQQLAIVYLGVSDLLGKQGDLKGVIGWENKAMRLLNSAYKTDDKNQGKPSKIGHPAIPINEGKGTKVVDYK